MKKPLILTIAAAATMVLAQGVLAADKPATAKLDCTDAATMPQAKSEKSRTDVKAEAKASAKAGTDCEASAAPAAKSTKARADVKEETKKAAKAGEIPPSETQQPKK